MKDIRVTISAAGGTLYWAVYSRGNIFWGDGNTTGGTAVQDNFTDLTGKTPLQISAYLVALLADRTTPRDCREKPLKNE